MNPHRDQKKTYLLVNGPMKGLVISCTVALEANSIPTLTFSLSNMLLDLGQSEEFWSRAAVAAAGVGAGGIRPAGLDVVLKPEDFTVLSYRDTMLLKDPWAPGAPGCERVLFLNAASDDSSRLYR